MLPSKFLIHKVQSNYSILSLVRFVHAIIACLSIMGGSILDDNFKKLNIILNSNCFGWSFKLLTKAKQVAYIQFSPSLENSKDQ